MDKGGPHGRHTHTYKQSSTKLVLLYQWWYTPHIRTYEHETRSRPQRSRRGTMFNMFAFSLCPQCSSCLIRHYIFYAVCIKSVVFPSLCILLYYKCKVLKSSDIYLLLTGLIMPQFLNQYDQQFQHKMQLHLFLVDLEKKQQIVDLSLHYSEIQCDLNIVIIDSAVPNGG